MSFHERWDDETQEAYEEYQQGLADHHELMTLKDPRLTDNDIDALIDAEISDDEDDDCPF